MNSTLRDMHDVLIKKKGQERYVWYLIVKAHWSACVYMCLYTGLTIYDNSG